MGERELERIREIALELPDVTERPSHGAPCFFIRNRIALCYYHDDFHGEGRISMWCPAPPGAQEELVETEPDRFFKPPTSARGTFASWLGVWLDSSALDDTDWAEVAAVLEDAYRTGAPKSLVAELDD